MTKTIRQGIFIFVAIFAAICVVGFLVQGADFIAFRFWSPKYQAVERQVFENTPSYNQGFIQELQSMRLDYVKSKDEKSKAAMSSIILHRVDAFGEDKLPPDLKSFVVELRTKQLDTSDSTTKY
jgi:hypothetical protein